MAIILPFIGYRSWEHDPSSDSPHVRAVCDMDLSGEKTYCYNSMGFRGEEFRPDACKRIFFSGCSYTFGVGLDLEETAAYKFKMHYCESLRLSADDVNLLNFAMPGASNEYIVRTLLSQCRRVKPDLVVAIFSHIDRAEYIDEEALGERVWTVAPWWIKEACPELVDPNTEADERVEIMRQASIGYFYYYTLSNALARFLQNALLLQFYCDLKSIPYVFYWVEISHLARLEHHFALAEMSQLLDIAHFANYSDLKRHVCDRAADAAHPGPISNSKMAKALFDKYEQLYGALSR
jgi:hypothetical protein